MLGLLIAVAVRYVDVTSFRAEHQAKYSLKADM
jgi:hypothetical protein